MRYRPAVRMLGAFGFAAALAAAGLIATAAAEDPPVRVRGTIETVDGNMLAIKSRDGAALKVRLTDNATVAAVVKASLADIKPGTFVGSAALPQIDGSWKAIEVVIFPEAMRGTGEGDRPWDLQPKSTMTNATVANAVSKVDGHSLTLTYKGGEKTIVVPPEAPIVTFAPGERSELKPGSKIFIAAATKQPDGTFEAARITVGRDTPPPM
jgi:hypothetical protein